MDELQKTTDQIKAALASTAKGAITEREFHEQMVNFVVGNAFDVFHETNTVTRQSVRKSERRRLSFAA